MLLSKYAVFDNKTQELWKGEASGLVSTLGLKTLLSKIVLLDKILFRRYKMNETVNMFLLAGDAFMPEIHLR